MSGQSTTWFRQQRLNETFRRVTLPFTTMQVALTRRAPASNSDVSQVATNEPVGYGYARPTVAMNGSAWTLISSTEIANTNEIVFPRASGPGWGMLHGWALIAVGVNRVVALGTLVEPLRCVGGIQPVLGPGTIVFGERD